MNIRRLAALAGLALAPALMVAAPAAHAAPATRATAMASINQEDTCPYLSGTNPQRLYCDDHWANANPLSSSNPFPIRVQGQDYHYTSNGNDSPQFVRFDSTSGKRTVKFYCYDGRVGTSSGAKWTYTGVVAITQSDAKVAGAYACPSFPGSGVLLSISGMYGSCGPYITKAFISATPDRIGARNYGWDYAQANTSSC